MPDKTIKYLKDYAVPNYLVEHVDLTFIIDNDKTIQVQNIVNYYKNPNSSANNILTLDGCAELISLAIDNHVLTADQYEQKEDCICINNLPDSFSLSVITLLKPWDNKSCYGLYASNNNLMTQCEPEGFRTITYYQDRPDVLATFTTTIIAAQGQYNTILSNGNKIQIQDNEDTANSLQIVKWHDPFKKPSYLFALVIANLEVLKDCFITKSGRRIELEIYSEAHSISQCRHAMDSVKRAMQWDETRFNLEYDLDIYMIVATSDFNMGAMENKGLNIFNTKYILADQKTATDIDFINVESVIGHEYFHNWTGNRVTCRDWFQLSLKEGLTVFRDHEFTADLHDRSVKRIQEAKFIRQYQFLQDNGPLAHSVRPESYMEINNFYTVTIYEKGAEVVRMYQTLLGNEGFNKGFELYIQRHDGKAATCENFCQAMADANNIDLSQFMLWYEQAGTPVINVSSHYDKDKKEFSLTFKQTIPDTPHQTNKKPMLIPIQIGLLDALGHELINITPIQGKYVKHNQGLTLLINETSNTFIFTNIHSKPIPSLLRNFSAPVKLEYQYTRQELLILASNDRDNFNRFEHLQWLFEEKIIALYNAQTKNENYTDNDPEFWKAAKEILLNPNLDPAFRATTFQIPTFSEMLTILKQVNPKILADTLNTLIWQIGDNLFDSWMEIYNLNLNPNSNYDFNDSGKRSLKNTALFYILNALSHRLNNPTSLQIIETIALGQFHNAHNMTDSFAVLTSTANINSNIRDQILQEFYQKWQHNELVMDKWFAIQAMSRLATTDMLDRLMVDKTFIATNPNKIYALLKTFTQNGLVFNTDAGYSFIADKVIMIDQFNPQVASALASGFNSAAYLNETWRKMAKVALNRIIEHKNLSNMVYEIVSKILSGLRV